MPLPPLSLYIHIPYCIKKCPYCDFNSHESKHIDENAYIDALIADLNHDLAYCQSRTIDSIFIGGGTPSLFSPNSIQQLLSQIRAVCALHPQCEITLEANPGTFEIDKFNGFVEAGVNRLSIGVQSFSDATLHAIGRIHDGAAALRAIEHACQLTRVNVDLMYGCPHQTPQQAIDDLKRAIDCGVTHLSWYQLTLEPNTVFYKKPPPLLDPDVIADYELTGQALLNAHGFAQYEVSAYAKGSHQCQHNLNYWHYGDYLGIGAGAHGKVTLADPFNIIRTRKHRMPASYLNQASHCVEQRSIVTQERCAEFMLNALRLTDGFTWQDFTERTDLSRQSIQAKIDHAATAGLLESDATGAKATTAGFRYLNNLIEIMS